MSDSAPYPIRLEVELQPETAEQPWHAVVRTGDGVQQLEFDSPLALVRHLASFNDPSTRRRGLR